jgi:uncharacterized coiled-coil protein SlyX
MKQEEIERLVALEIKLEHLEETVREIKEDCQETKEQLIALGPKLDALIQTVNEVKAKQASNSPSEFIKTNWKFLLILLCSLLGIKFGPDLAPHIYDDKLSKPVVEQHASSSDEH